ncbi:hypothetical protein [Nocardia seriolae]|uniref:Secreted protein n=1 Tax=Nocardia seriolae TaxID=37332 RepID=A0ABC8B6D1_9NOCA|nr:hypothetical protein [Nocardia seriolae]APB01593.1 hypothetical protein NS506_07573 [Nocardia seriolae]MTK51508.1 hypothetical protein [Nocardia seriolae]OJF78337.1 hypothetical protein NS14008_02785 [Nocardia seriolae]PSK26704.1 hypothetical protein C6575_35835 [Nocardia seriolae]QOW31440.1 hypothetical protein IMZ23_25515 [Nocardia seriolae]
MSLDTCAFILVVLCCALIVATIRWSVSDDSAPTPPAPSDALLVAGGHPLPRVPLHNRHRVHGRHRAL